MPAVSLQNLTKQFHGQPPALRGSYYYSQRPYQMAAAVTAIVPILIVFFVAQRHFVRGIQLTGLK